MGLGNSSKPTLNKHEGSDGVTVTSELDERDLRILRAISKDWGDAFVKEDLLPSLASAAKMTSRKVADIREALSDPYWFLILFFQHYAFARRGKDRDELANMAVQAVRDITTPETIGDILAGADGEAIWEAFERICAENKRKSSEQLNKGILAGTIELAQEIAQLGQSGSIADWVVEGIQRTGRVEPQFLRIVDIRGMGPKTTSTLLRDLVYLFDLESEVDNVDQLYLQPMDRWVRAIGHEIIPEDVDDRTPDWVLAGKISKYSRRARVSGVKFNMGASHFGPRVVRDLLRLDQALEELVSA